MTWQAIVLAVGQILFSVALLPSIFTSDKPEIWTSAMTGSVALSVSIAYFTLGIKFASAMAFLNFVAWSVLAVQKFRQPKRLKKERRTKPI